MSRKKTFTEKLNAFIFGAPHPNGNKPSSARHLEEKVDELLTLLKSQPALDELVTQVRKLAKTQFKTNTLQESQVTQQQETIASLQKSLEQLEKQQLEMGRQHQQAVEAAQVDLLSSLLPVLDSLDAAFDTGRRQVLKLQLDPPARRAVIAWLDGVRLARLRLMGVLEAHQITPIPAVGQSFDPNCHVAVAVKSDHSAPAGTIIAEDRRGYATSTKVLRFAEVVVARPE